MIVKLLNEYHLEFLSLKGGCTGSSESTHVKMPYCWKLHVAAQMCSPIWILSVCFLHPKWIMWYNTTLQNQSICLWTTELLVEFLNLFIWAATTWFPTMWHLTSVDSDEPVHSPFKFRNSKWCSVSSLTLIEYSSDKQRLWSDCGYVQAGLSLCWSHIPHCWKSHVTAHIYRSRCGVVDKPLAL